MVHMTNNASNLVIIPTYNERENVANIVQSALASAPQAHVLVVDDNSPDGTAKIVSELAGTEPRVRLLLREKKEGLGPAYIAGFRWGMSHGYDRLVQMDADFSHNPKDLPRLLEALDRYEVVIASRYTAEGATEGWPWYRQLVSRGGNFYARTILSAPYRDMTGGFNGWRRDVLERIDLETVRSEGYAFMVELKYRALSLGCSWTEIPIVFCDRQYGVSKMTSNIVIEAAFRVLRLKLRSLGRTTVRKVFATA
jgi:dolichol-phosphate mannosyltransferase